MLTWEAGSTPGFQLLATPYGVIGEIALSSATVV